MIRPYIEEVARRNQGGRCGAMVLLELVALHAWGGFMRDTILITDQDMSALTQLIGRTHPFGRDQEHLAILADELERATVVPSTQVPADVVTMGSRVRVQDV